MGKNWLPMEHETVLLPGEYLSRFGKCKAYLKRLRQDNLLMYYRMEAGLFNMMRRIDGIHGGWDSPTSFGKGMFTGHWLSAASMAVTSDGDTELRARLDAAIETLRQCQTENGNGWAFAVPEKHLTWLKRGKYAYNPFYSIHKSLMGYMDAWRYAGNQTALQIVKDCAIYFSVWCGDVTRGQMDRIMNENETGGILEIWAQLYTETHDPAHLALMRLFERPELYGALADDRDFLTNMHANTTLPEIAGAAACYEATGEDRYRQAVEAYWRKAVQDRGVFVTGGQTSGEVWTPPGDLADRLGELTQEHCTVYNLMKIADYLLRWTGKSEYADYIERCLTNGVLAQTFLTARSLDVVKEPYPPQEFIVSYFLPLGYGTTKKWGTETEDFWCCHGTAVQANTQHAHRIWFKTPEGLALCQYIPSRVKFRGGSISLQTTTATGELISLAGRRAAGQVHRPNQLEYEMTMDFAEPQEFAMLLRLPWWLSGNATLTIDGSPCAFQTREGFISIQALWHRQHVSLAFPKSLHIEELPGEPDTVAFMDGPAVLAGLTDGQYELYGDVQDAQSILAPYDERGWTTWNPGWRTVNQPKTIRFVPLNTVTEERYTVYFPVRPRKHVEDI